MFLGFLINNLTSPSKTAPSPAFSPLDTYFQETAYVVEPIEGRQKGRVQLHGVYWFAKLSHPTAKSVKPGCTVAVVGKENNTLIVVLMP
ncbi:MAG: NfeD family protein [Phormidesmis sp.]